MAYRLTKPELRIIEQTKLEGERLERDKEAGAGINIPDTPEGDDGQCGTFAGRDAQYEGAKDKDSHVDDSSPEHSTDKDRNLKNILKPYLFFLVLMLGIVIAVAALLYLTS